MYVLTVTTNTGDDVHIHGLFIGRERKLFEEAVAKLSHEEVAAIVSAGCSFVYSAERGDKAGNLVVIGEWAYPKK